MTKKEVFEEINRTQDEYVSKLIGLINSPDYFSMKIINFTSPTGTGKTRMMAKLINYFQDYYFIVTTLSKGQLNKQVRMSLEADCDQENFYVYGSADYKINSVLDSQTILSKIPTDTKCIWLRDEGHIKTNRFEELLINRCYKVINISATNTHSDIQCNFAHTMMLRTVNQAPGSPEDAIRKLLEIKKVHKCVKNYNPCAIFRCVGGKHEIYNEVVRLCQKYKLKYIDITEDAYIMAELCEDNNKYDVIINKYKIVEGIDIRRAHVLYMDNQPTNNATTIQAIGRCRRNALIYRDDIDIFDDANTELLEKTRECYVYYNVDSMKIDTDENGELYYAFCDHISCELLKPNTRIYVSMGQLSNGLHIVELENKTGWYEIQVDEQTGFNVVCPETDFYNPINREYNNVVYVDTWHFSELKRYRKILIEDIEKFPVIDRELIYTLDRNGKLERKIEKHNPLYALGRNIKLFDVSINVSNSIVDFYEEKKKEILRRFSLLKTRFTDTVIQKIQIPASTEEMEKFVNDYLAKSNRGVLHDFLFGLSCKKIDVNRYIGGVYKESINITDLFGNAKRVTSMMKYCCVLLKKRNVSANIIVSRFFDFVNILLFSNIAYTETEMEKIVYLYMMDDVERLNAVKLLNAYNYDTFIEYMQKNYLKVRARLGEKVEITTYDIELFFEQWSYKVGGDKYFYNGKELFRIMNEYFTIIGENLKKGIIDCTEYLCDKYSKPVSEEELYLISKAKLYKPVSYLPVSQKDSYSKYKAYSLVYNDRESAIIGVDFMQQIDLDYGKRMKDSKYHQAKWVESRSVTSKIGRFSKLNRYISKRYRNELKQAQSQYFTGKNELGLDNKCNSMIGYCVEYYSKYILYGREFLASQFEKDGTDDMVLEDYHIVHACMLKYKEMMAISFGSGVAKMIRIMSLAELEKENHRNFIRCVVSLGKRTAEFVKKTMYPNADPKNNIDPNLSISHIAGLADYITEDTILDVKVRNYIDEKSVRQVLAYHYLSTKRSDLHIKKVVVYDATSDRAVKIDICGDSTNDAVLAVTGAEYLFFDLFKSADTNFVPVNINRVAIELLAKFDEYRRAIVNDYYWERLDEQEIAKKHYSSVDVIKKILDECRLALKFEFWELYINRPSDGCW